jgi:hypothetical protein
MRTGTPSRSWWRAPPPRTEKTAKIAEIAEKTFFLCVLRVPGGFFFFAGSADQ